MCQACFPCFVTLWGEDFHHPDSLSDAGFLIFSQLPFWPFPTCQCSDPPVSDLFSVFVFPHLCSGNQMPPPTWTLGLPLLVQGIYSLAYMQTEVCGILQLCFRHDLWMLLSAFLVDHNGFRRRDMYLEKSICCYYSTEKQKFKKKLPY